MKEKRGEHPFGDFGQLILAALFLAVWVGDSFLLHWSPFLKHRVPESVRMGLLGFALLFVLILLATEHGSPPSAYDTLSIHQPSGQAITISPKAIPILRYFSGLNFPGFNKARWLRGRPNFFRMFSHVKLKSGGSMP
jgi:hypothetical protein